MSEKEENERKFFWLIVIALSIVLSFVLSNSGQNSDIFSILGRATGIIMFPAIIALILSGITRIFKKKLTGKEFQNIYAVVWVIGLFTQLIPHFYGL